MHSSTSTASAETASSHQPPWRITRSAAVLRFPTACDVPEPVPGPPPLTASLLVAPSPPVPQHLATLHPGAPGPGAQTSSVCASVWKGEGGRGDVRGIATQGTLGQSPGGDQWGRGRSRAFKSRSLWASCGRCWDPERSGVTAQPGEAHEDDKERQAALRARLSPRAGLAGVSPLLRKDSSL